MRFESIQDVLDHGRAMHQQIANFYRQLDDASARARVRLLIDYLAVHEQHLADTLQGLQDVTEETVLHSWLEHIPDPALFEETLHTPIRTDMEVDEVLEIAMRFDDAMIELYQTLAERAESQEVRDLLRNLTELENIERRRIVRNAMMMQDI